VEEPFSRSADFPGRLARSSRIFQNPPLIERFQFSPSLLGPRSLFYLLLATFLSPPLPIPPSRLFFSEISSSAAIRRDFFLLQLDLSLPFSPAIRIVLQLAPSYEPSRLSISTRGPAFTSLRDPTMHDVIFFHGPFFVDWTSRTFLFPSHPDPVPSTSPEYPPIPRCLYIPSSPNTVFLPSTRASNAPSLSSAIIVHDVASFSLLVAITCTILVTSLPDAGVHMSFIFLFCHHPPPSPLMLKKVAHSV